MTAKKYIGVWMDHSVANIMALTGNEIITNCVESEFTHQQKEHALSKNENLMHNKEQHQQSKYYKKIADAIKDYENIILFGPTTAKSELLNLLKADHHFEKTKIEVKQTDKMTENQQHAFVKDHFELKEHQK
jgi:stalled ribosome rescue protein Dom34